MNRSPIIEKICKKNCAPLITPEQRLRFITRQAKTSKDIAEIIGMCGICQYTIKQGKCRHKDDAAKNNQLNGSKNTINAAYHILGIDISNPVINI